MRAVTIAVAAAAMLQGCADIEVTRRRDPAELEMNLRSGDKKQELLAFMRRFKRALETDAFAEPQKLKSVLALETLTMKPFEGYTVPKGASLTAERVKYTQQTLDQIKSNVAAIDAVRDNIQYFVRIAGIDSGYWAFSIDKMHQAICLTEGDVEAIFGKPNRRLPLPSHALADYVPPSGYRFITLWGPTDASFSYVSVGSERCVKSVRAGFRP